MANQYFRDRLRINISAALASATTASQIDHPGIQGRIREVTLNQLLKPLLPTDVDVGTGKIVDATGRQSAETDVIIYSPRLLPPLLYAPDEGLFPVEACLFAVEVKSKATSNEVTDAISKSRRLQELSLSSGKALAAVSLAVTSLFFAYGSDLAKDGKTELERYRALDMEADSDPAIQGICVAGRGYWIYSRGGAGCWMTSDARGEHEEVIDFLGGIVNSLPEKMSKRGLPSLGHYLLENKTPRPA